MKKTAGWRAVDGLRLIVDEKYVCDYSNFRKIKTDCRGEKEAVAYICMVMESDEWQRREIGWCTV
jgi:hypothetical protein